MTQERAYSQFFAQATHAKHRIFQEAGSDAHPRMTLMHGQPAQDSDGNWTGHVATHPPR